MLSSPVHLACVSQNSGKPWFRAREVSVSSLWVIAFVQTSAPFFSILCRVFVKRQMKLVNVKVFGSVRNARLALLVTLTTITICPLQKHAEIWQISLSVQEVNLAKTITDKVQKVLPPEVRTAHDSINFSKTTWRSFLSSPRLTHSRKHSTMTMMFPCCYPRPRGFRRSP